MLKTIRLYSFPGGHVNAVEDLIHSSGGEICPQDNSGLVMCVMCMYRNMFTV